MSIRRRTRIAVALTAIVALAALAAGCGDKKEEKKADLPPPAQTPLQWANRAVDWFLRPMAKDLQVLDRLRVPGAFIFLATGEPETVRIVDRRMTDLGKCTDKLARVGPPPNLRDRPKITDPLLEMHDDWLEACEHYEKVSELMLDALDLFQRGEEGDQQRAVAIVGQVAEPSRLGAIAYQRGLELAQKHPALRIAGVRPPS